MRKIALLVILIMLFICVGQFDNGTARNSTANKLLNDLNYQDESINFDLSETYDITVLVKFNINQFNRSSVQIKNDEQLNNYRNNVKDYYVFQNEKVIEKMDLDSYLYDFSFYAPFMEIVFDDTREFEAKKDNLLSILNENDDVECFSINYISFDEATVNSNACSSNYALATAKSDIGIPTSLTYTGNGIKIGTIESGTPNSTSNLKSDKFTRLSTSTTSHSTWVTSIIGGYTGIAENAHIYCIGLSDYTFTTCVNTLIYNCGVNVINMSNARNNLGYYDYYCAYIDYIVKDSNCTFVQAAGNNGPGSNPNISSPGCGMNVITVGSISADKNVSYYSSWYTSNSFLFKPDMVAPGENISNIPNLSGSNSGTSFSAPMVAGVVALLMEEFPSLKFNPSLVKSALHNGCIELSSQTTYFDEQCGFGLVNYQKSKYYLSNSQYNNFNIPINCVNGDIVASYNVTIPSCKKIEINANWIINSANVNPGDSSYTPLYTKCYIKLYDIQSSSYVKSISKNSNTVFLEYINSSTASRQYRIDVVVNGSKASGGIEVGSLVYNIEKTHTHDYLYVWKNYTQHRTSCLCGILDIDPHVVSPDAFNNGQQYATCLLCGGLASIGIIYYDGINQSFPTTANGSFILPNGVIVLKDEDMDAYLEGTLIFNYPNSDLVNGKMAIPQYLRKKESNLYN